MIGDTSWTFSMSHVGDCSDDDENDVEPFSMF